MGKQTGKYSTTQQAPRKNRAGVMVTLMLAFVLLAAAGTVLLLRNFPVTPPQRETQQAAEPTVQPSIEPTTQPEPAAEPSNTPVVIPSGDKTLVTCKASFTAAPGSQNPEKVVATAGNRELTNGMLQILYLSQVNDYRASNEEIAPDYSRPLDCQPCPLEAGLSWQHYFLKKAVLSWQAQQAALEQAEQPRPITEEAFKPDLTDNMHEKYVSADLPVNDFLYQDQDRYTPNALHQSYLDSLGNTLDALAAEAGFSNLDAMAQRLGVSAGDYLKAAQDYNTAYMLFTEESYDLAPADGVVLDYLQKHGAQLSSSNGGGETVDIRHILLIPQGAAVAADGTVTATQEQWAQTEQKARDILEEWNAGLKYREADSEFARLANIYSQDSGSQSNGGAYYSLHPGQLAEPLDEWCFANGRQQGDTGILRSDYGCHILYLAAFRESNITDARNALIAQQEREQWVKWLKRVPLTPDYSAVQLWVDTTVRAVSLTDTLYPDIAHQRFPEPIVYFQQDYHYSPFGDRTIGLNGCGVTAFAMLATYMTDSLYTPAMIGLEFEAYYDKVSHGTNGNMFIYAPSQLGFYMDKLCFDANELVEALKNGQAAISRQEGGDFTSTGHYLLICGYNEEDDTFQVRDSNIYNYSNKQGHKVDKFTRANILSGGALFYIMQPKITFIPACDRCGGAATPSPLLVRDYTCEKCAVALARRDSFLFLLNEFSSSASIH